MSSVSFAAVTSRESFVELESYAGRGLPRRDANVNGAWRAAWSSGLPSIPAAKAATVVDFWREEGPERWFAKDTEFDRRFRECFWTWHEAAAHGELVGWAATATGALALVLLLDQYPRNAFRGRPRMYATDAAAREVATVAIDLGYDSRVEPALRLFFYLPFAHSEVFADQDRSVALNRPLGEPNLSRSERHRDIIRRFGRFPHRNPILGRKMTSEEQRFLDEGGFAG